MKSSRDESAKPPTQRRTGPKLDPNAAPENFKIFPRNLTARAAYIVRGNPANSRPESAVNNCFPGLEFDQRNIEERFFPGLRFNFLRDDGAVLTAIPDKKLERQLNKEGLVLGPAADERGFDPNENPLFFWALYGRTVTDEPEPDLFDFYWVTGGSIGLYIWRRVNALLPGRCAIALGPAPGSFAARSEAFELMKKLYRENAKTPCHRVERDSNHRLQFAVFAGERASYLTEDGVLDVELYEPGDLTKTMCAPWMYDFRDCFCFYWSSNKPDIVASPDGDYPYVDFMRKRYPTDDAFYQTEQQPQEVTSRYDKELDYQDMVEGWWERLPVVLNGRETSADAQPKPAPDAQTILTRGEVVAELLYLASVEHALMVEYLYAYYSLSVLVPADPNGAWESSGSTPGCVQGAASELLQIARSEMRHLLWANMLLRWLGHPPTLQRAERIAEPPTAGSGRRVYAGKHKEYLDKKFKLSPLDRATLDWFIDVEAPSRVIGFGLDGMYVEILESLKQWPPSEGDSARLIPLVKLIVDEGHDHYIHFRAIRSALAGIPEQVYLRRIVDEPEGGRLIAYSDLADELYKFIVVMVYISLCAAEEHIQSDSTKQAVQLMMALDQVARILGNEYILPRFRQVDIDSINASHEHIDTWLTDETRALNEAIDALQRMKDVTTVEQGTLQNIKQTVNDTSQYFHAALNAGSINDKWRA